MVGYIGNAPIQPGGFGFTDRTASLAEILSHKKLVSRFNDYTFGVFTARQTVVP